MSIKEGVVQEGKQFRAYFDGEYIGRAYHYRGAEILVEKAKGTYVSKRGRKPKNANVAMATPKAPKVKKTVVQQAAPETAVVAAVVPLRQPEKVTAAQYIPKKDEYFVPFGEFKNIDTIIASGRFFPVYVTGPTGNGKSSMVEQSCAKNKRNYIRLQVNAQTDEDQLIGTKTLVDGNIQIVEGPVLIAMRTGSVLLVDEIDAGDPNNIMCLQSILEGRPYYFKLKNEMVYPAPGFNIIATGNTKGRGSSDGKYIGTKMLNEAFLERFAVTLCQEYPSASVELRIVKGAMTKNGCMDEKFAGCLVKWADAIRRTYEDGAIDDLITTRRLIQIVEAFAIFKDAKVAVSLGCNRFDSITRATFIDVFDKITPDDAAAKEDATIPVKTETTEATTI